MRVKKITQNPGKTSRKAMGKVTTLIQKKKLVVSQGKTWSETGGNYLLEPTGNGRHFAGR